MASKVTAGDKRRLSAEVSEPTILRLREYFLIVRRGEPAGAYQQHTISQSIDAQPDEVLNQRLVLQVAAGGAAAPRLSRSINVPFEQSQRAEPSSSLAMARVVLSSGSITETSARIRRERKVARIHASRRGEVLQTGRVLLYPRAPLPPLLGCPRACVGFGNELSRLSSSENSESARW